jgi:hypothetical protein
MTIATLLREDLGLRMQDEDENEDEYAGDEEEEMDDLTADEGDERDEDAELGDFEEEGLPEVE